MVNDRLATIARVFPDDSPGYPKSEILYRLAREADGPIVEVGAGRGMGSISLAFGALDGHGGPVYVIDPFAETRGWANEPYGPSLKSVWFENVRAAGVLERVQLVMLPIEIINWPWPYPAALTFWDIARRLDGEAGQWLAGWYRASVLPGGIVAINETGGDDLSVDAWLAEHRGMELLGIDYRIRITRKIYG